LELRQAGRVRAQGDIWHNLVPFQRRWNVAQPGEQAILRFHDYAVLRHSLRRARYLTFGLKRGSHLHNHSHASFLLRLFAQFLESLIERRAASHLGGDLSLRFDGG